jgi:hypothetical protein
MTKQKEKVETKTINKSRGIPMSEESYKEWQKAFIDMEECFEYLEKHRNKK